MDTGFTHRGVRPGHGPSSQSAHQLWTYFTPPTSVLYAVCNLHLLVHFETLSLTFAVWLLLLLGVRLLALPVHRHYYSRVRDSGGVRRCGVRHLLGGLRFQWGTPKMSHPGEKCRLSDGERPGDRGVEGGRLLAGLQVQLRQFTLCKGVIPEIRRCGLQNKRPLSPEKCVKPMWHI